jgi:alpha-D-ribose 1-methylphosphonate 5-triphosphate diphosphatase
MSYETILANARIVLPAEVVTGTLVIRGGRIAELYAGRGVPYGAVDCGNDLVLPGMIELHTDNLEKHVSPRPGVAWPLAGAVMAHDSQIAAAGITTVCDALTIGDLWGNPARAVALRDLVRALDETATAGALRSEHFVHLRAELSHGNLLDAFSHLADHPRVKVVTLMDHTPGQRQFADVAQYRRYYQGKNGVSDAEMDALLERHREGQRRNAAPNRARVVEIARGRAVLIGSHDDACADHVAEAAACGAAFTEFPTTPEAAEAAHARGIAILLGAPNVVRGGSHSGNVSALDLARADRIDVLSSDYVPSSLIHGVLRLHRDGGMSLPAAVATTTTTPATLLGLEDRGRIEIGARADILRVSDRDDIPVIRAVWREGARVA